MRVPDLQPLAAGVAALLLAASVGWWLFSAPEQIDPGHPTWKGADIVRLTAAVPQIDDFNHFYVNDDNPFVPLQARLAENDRRRVLREGPRLAQQPPRPAPIPPPRKPVDVVEPKKPVLELPRLVAAPSNSPTVFGLVAVDGQEAVIVRMPGAKDSLQLVPGKQVDGWTLVSIDNGNLATFTDPLGVEQRFLIGQGDLAVAQNQDGAGSGGKPGDAAVPKGPAGRGMVPKAPGQGAGTNGRPGTTGAEGPVPRPPPREERRRPPKEPPKDQQGRPMAPVVPK